MYNPIHTIMRKSERRGEEMSHLQSSLLERTSDGGQPAAPRPRIAGLVGVNAAGLLSVVGGLGAVGRKPAPEHSDAERIAADQPVLLCTGAFSLACTTPCMHALGYQGCLEWGPTLAATYVLLAVPLTAIATSALTVELGRRQSTAGLLAVGVLSLAAAGAAMALLLKPWAAYDYLEEKDANGNEILAVDCLQGFLGGGIFLTALALASAAFAAAAGARNGPAGGPGSTWKRQPIASSDPEAEVAGEPEPQPQGRPSLAGVTDRGRRPCCAALGLLLLWAALTCCCAALSPVWNFSFHSYTPYASPYSLLPDTAILGTFHDAGTTWGKPSEHHWLLKLYTDTVVFYGAFSLLTVGAALLSVDLRPARLIARVVHRRIRLPGVAKCPGWHPFPEGATVGECIVVGGVVGLYGWWLWYWRWGYDRIAEEGDEAHSLDNHWNHSTNSGGKCCVEYGIPPPANGSSWAAGNAGACVSRADSGARAWLHVWARVLGHLTSLSCALLLLPATKNSAWFQLLGIPFERALKYHRGLGLVTYLLVTVHMLLWWLKWLLEGTLWHNLTRPDDLKISPDW